MELLGLVAIVIVILLGWAVIDLACAAMSSRINRDDREDEDK